MPDENTVETIVLLKKPVCGKDKSKDCKIENAKELEFVIFCIENIASRLGKSAESVYSALAEKSDILNNYIVDDILAVMESEGVSDMHCMSDGYLVEEYKQKSLLYNKD